MTEYASGKDHTGENFPVASWLVAPEYRAPIMAFYRFARAADDIADHATAPAAEKLRLLAEMRAALPSQSFSQIDPAHANDLLDAFTLDVTKNRYDTWDDLIAYCRLSAMPVGRFVLDVHGEDRALWPMNDALCAALQIINHLQDCGKDYRAINRVYIPEPMLTAAGIGVSDLGAAQASPALLAVIRDLARQTQALLAQSAPFAKAIRDWRLSAEVAVIQALAEDLCRGLLSRDPLCERVHHGKLRMAWLALTAVVWNGLKR